jgi:carbamoyl-phosphate synthase large subunit
MQPNILITSCGAKVALVRAFRQAAAERGGKVFVSDVSDHAPALYDADGRVHLPPWDDPGYADRLMGVCRDLDIGLLVPTSDRELFWLEPLADVLRASGVIVLIPSLSTLNRCRDKRVFTTFCRQHGFLVPQSYEDAAEPTAFPVFVRPRMGQGGLGAGRVDTSALLQAMRQQDGELLVQEFIDGVEYSIDLLMDIQGGRALQAVARRRVLVYGGEAQVSRIERLDELTDLVMQLGEALGLVGHTVVQAFYSPEDGARFIEVNPRFGGASNLSIRAGLDSPARLLDLMLGDETARLPREIAYGLTLLRHGEDRFVNPGDAP